MSPRGVSVVITSCNYGDYVGAAIASALTLDWPQVEVIVVDDGSTDDSRAVIAGFGSRISVVLQENAGQLAAYNAGFARARGEAVIFLDADDLLAPSLVREVARVWSAQVSKVQVQMRVIDAAGRPTGSCFPQYAVAPTPGRLRAWALAAGAYPTPPGSGNVYARWFLERLFPLRAADTVGDTYPIAAAPLLGQVMTIAKPLVAYRVHGRNQGALSALDAGRFAKEVSRGVRRHAYACRIARQAGLALRPHALERSLHDLSYRLASLVLAPSAHPLAGDSAPRVLRDFVRAASVPQGFSAAQTLLLLAWAAAVAAAPRPLAARLVLWRFSSVARPRTLRRLLGALRIAPHAASGAADKICSR